MLVASYIVTNLCYCKHLLDFSQSLHTQKVKVQIGNAKKNLNRKEKVSSRMNIRKQWTQVSNAWLIIGPSIWYNPLLDDMDVGALAKVVQAIKQLKSQKLKVKLLIETPFIENEELRDKVPSESRLLSGVDMIVKHYNLMEVKLTTADFDELVNSDKTFCDVDCIGVLRRWNGLQLKSHENGGSKPYDASYVQLSNFIARQDIESKEEKKDKQKESIPKKQESESVEYESVVNGKKEILVIPDLKQKHGNICAQSAEQCWRFLHCCEAVLEKFGVKIPIVLLNGYDCVDVQIAKLFKGEAVGTLLLPSDRMLSHNKTELGNCLQTTNKQKKECVCV
ncbi:hypothetical protein RFI_14633 [Reticulomyxa filosa]|uniref:Uncharacterized protein n=1 Tax=Reticulomyxa filosa TaxID=46433 RepID=X6N8F2_RETFI|nr:hypothetical protein RFI_14633 [Reticulomyxa filosa]|eukprot:ETO22560.1 hypothetical protein RFI_14633 [Reticulomyxa filosa]